VPAGERVPDAVLLQVVAGRHLPAEAVAPVLDGHQRRRVGRRLHQDWDVQIGHAERVSDAALVAEIRQRHDDAVNRIPMLAEEVGARPRLLPRLDRPVFRVGWPEHHDFDARLLQDRDHLLAAALRKVVREEAPIADDQSNGHMLLARHLLLPPGGKPMGIEGAEHDQDRSPPDAGVQFRQHDGPGWRGDELIEPRAGDQHTVRQQQDSDEEPDGDHTRTMHVRSLVGYQKITLRTTKTRATTTAQNIGRW
jgi:hypothetical protein